MYANDLGKPAERCARCGEEESRIELHHPDYGTPDLVVPLCCKCHRAVHKENPGLRRPRGFQKRRPDLVYRQFTIGSSLDKKLQDDAWKARRSVSEHLRHLIASS